MHKYQLINLSGQFCYLTGEGEVNNAVELFVDNKFEALLYHIEKDNIKWLANDEYKTSELIKEFIIHYNSKIRKYMPLYNKFADKLEEILVMYYDKLSFDGKLKLVKDMLIVADTGAGRIKLEITANNTKISFGEHGRLVKTIYPQEVEWINASRTGMYSSVCKY